jgi:hypothetical protein
VFQHLRRELLERSCKLHHTFKVPDGIVLLVHDGLSPQLLLWRALSRCRRACNQAVRCCPPDLNSFQEQVNFTNFRLTASVDTHSLESRPCTTPTVIETTMAQAQRVRPRMTFEVVQVRSACVAGSKAVETRRATKET